MGVIDEVISFTMFTSSARLCLAQGKRIFIQFSVSCWKPYFVVLLYVLPHSIHF